MVALLTSVSAYMHLEVAERKRARTDGTGMEYFDCLAAHCMHHCVQIAL